MRGFPEKLRGKQPLCRESGVSRHALHQVWDENSQIICHRVAFEMRRFSPLESRLLYNQDRHYPGESGHKMLRPLKCQIPSQVGETNQAVLAEPELGWLRAEISKVGQNTFSTSPTLPQNVNGYRQFRD